MRITVIILALLLGGCGDQIDVVERDEVEGCEKLARIWSASSERVDNMGDEYRDKFVIDNIKDFALDINSETDTMIRPVRYVSIPYAWVTDTYICKRR